MTDKKQKQADKKSIQNVLMIYDLDMKLCEIGVNADDLVKRLVKVLTKTRKDERKQTKSTKTKAINAWCKWYSGKVGRINAGSKETYTGYEQDLFEVFGCSEEPFEKE